MINLKPYDDIPLSRSHTVIYMLLIQQHTLSLKYHPKSSLITLMYPLNFHIPYG